MDVDPAPADSDPALDPAPADSEPVLNQAASDSDPVLDQAAADSEPVLDHYGEYRTLLDAVAHVLDGVDRALAQLADGCYGRCSECGAPIGDDVLAADPTAQRCEDHATG